MAYNRLEEWMDQMESGAGRCLSLAVFLLLYDWLIWIWSRWRLAPDWLLWGSLESSHLSGQIHGLPLLLFTAKSQPVPAWLWRQLPFLSTQHLLDSSLIPYGPDHDSKSLTLHKAFMTHSDHSRTCGLRPILAPTSYLLKCSSYAFLGRPGPRGFVHVRTKSVRPHPKFAHSTIYPQSYF